MMPIYINQLVKGLNHNEAGTKKNDRHFADDFFKPNFLDEKCRIVFQISQKYVLMCQIDNIPALV